MEPKTLHFITNGRLPNSELIQLIKKIHHEVDYIHLREKQRTALELIQIIEGLEEAGVPTAKLMINDRADVAYVKQCAGVQLAYHSPPASLLAQHFPALLIGKSVHSLEEASLAEKEGADFVLFGHIFSTQSKADQSPRGSYALEKIAKNLSIPVVAIGGISAVNTHEVLDSGAKGIAVISGIADAEDPQMSAKAYRAALNER